MNNIGASIEYLVVPLSSNATSFCYYDNPNYYQAECKHISLLLLEKIVAYAKTNKLTINFIYGNNDVPDYYEEIIESVPHVKILPIKMLPRYPDGAVVINDYEISTVSSLTEYRLATAFLRIRKNHLSLLSSIVCRLNKNFKRINVIILDMQDFNDEDFKVYSRQLKTLQNYTTNLLVNGKAVEVSILTDRLLLDSMNNCNAGIVHITVGLNGKFYLCPGFLYDDVENSSGDLQNGIIIKNSRLLNLENAPLCFTCNAYHCKRCFYLNNKLTLEINTPSHQQCVLSHTEQECTRRISKSLERKFPHKKNQFSTIPKLSYIDPIEVFNENKQIVDKKYTIGINKLPLLKEDPLSSRHIDNDSH